MKKIDISTPTYPNTFALVDDEDYERINSHNWHASKLNGILYATRCFRRRGRRWSIPMHRAIMNLPKGFEVDHRSGNGINNQKYNLRTCTHQQNLMNRKLNSNSTSGYKGVSWYKRNNKWQVNIQKDGKQLFLGYYTCLIKAAKAYDAVAKELFGEYARLNFTD
jgi:hypothetical protein